MKIALLLISVSFLADQVFQPREVMKYKHKESQLHFMHTILWTAIMACLASLICFFTGDLSTYKWLGCIAVIKFAVSWCCNRMWTYQYNANNRDKMVLWILLESTIVNCANIWLFEHFISK